MFGSVFLTKAKRQHLLKEPQAPLPGVFCAALFFKFLPGVHRHRTNQRIEPQTTVSAVRTQWLARKLKPCYKTVFQPEPRFWCHLRNEQELCPELIPLGNDR